MLFEIGLAHRQRLSAKWFGREREERRRNSTSKGTETEEGGRRGKGGGDKGGGENKKKKKYYNLNNKYPVNIEISLIFAVFMIGC